MCAVCVVVEHFLMIETLLLPHPSCLHLTRRACVGGDQTVNESRCEYARQQEVVTRMQRATQVRLVRCVSETDLLIRQ